MTDQGALKYKRILLKMSGEALVGKTQQSIDPEVIDRIVYEVHEVYQLGVEIAIVIGGGNFFRGAQLSEMGIDRITGDSIGMLATLMNSLALRHAFEKLDLPVRILSAIPVGGVADQFDLRKAVHHLKRRRIIIFSAGTGNPLVTTDSAASLRGIEIEADVVLKATHVDGVFSSDPSKDKDAVLLPELTYKEALDKELAVMDLAAFCQCRDHNMPLRIFNITKPGALLRVILGEPEGSLVY